jgi:hypothetical protein
MFTLDHTLNIFALKSQVGNPDVPLFHMAAFQRMRRIESTMGMSEPIVPLSLSPVATFYGALPSQMSYRQPTDPQRPNNFFPVPQSRRL